MRQDCDTYMSQAFFARPCRRAVHVAWMTHGYIDLDLYKLPVPPNPGIAAIFLRTFCGDEGIPEPSIIVFSGRGIYCKWMWSSPLPRAAAGRAVAVNRALVRRFTEWGADPRAVDVSRILRIVGTTNSKSGRQAEILHQAERDGEVLTYEFNAFADGVLKYTLEQVRGFREQAKARAEIRAQREIQQKHGHRRPFVAEDWCCGVLEDLRILADIRWGGIVQPGYRDIFGHVGACCLAHIAAPDQLWHEILAWGRIILPADYALTPAFKSDCSTLLRNAKRAAEGGTDTYRDREVSPIYTYRANTLIERLAITPDEERLLTRLISPAEKHRRLMERRRAAGEIERGLWLAQHAISRDRPWETEGISRATWYRQRNTPS